MTSLNVPDNYDRLFSIHPWKGVTITMYGTGRDYRGATTVEVVVRDNGRTIFGPGVLGMRMTGALSPLHSDDGIDAKRFALAYAAMQPEDASPDFEEAYTPDQRAWAEANGERLSLVAFHRYGDD